MKNTLELYSLFFSSLLKSIFHEDVVLSEMERKFECKTWHGLQEIAKLCQKD